MKFQVRRGVFEPNSSSVHSITMCSASDFDNWRTGGLVFDRWNDCLTYITDEIANSMSDEKSDDFYRYYTFNDFFSDYEKMEYETFEGSFITKSGEEVVAFGYYGHD